MVNKVKNYVQFNYTKLLLAFEVVFQSFVCVCPPLMQVYEYRKFG